MDIHNIPMRNPIDFDSIDWVALARSRGLYVGTQDDVVLSLMPTDEREALAYCFAQELIYDNEMVLSSISDQLDELVEAGNITTFDKACIKLQVSRIAKAHGIEV